MSDESQPPVAPEWPVELVEPIQRLGNPLEAFHFPKSHASRRVFTGLVLILLSLIGQAIYYLVLGFPFVPQFTLLLVFFGPIATGLGLVYSAIRDRGLWVLVYPTGLLRWQRGDMVSFPWDEIVEIFFHRVIECGRPKRKLGPNGEWIGVWLPIVKMRSKSLGAYLTLRREDGSEAILPTSLENFTRLLKTVQDQTFRILWPKMTARLAEGKKVHFGLVSIGGSGIYFRDERLRWPDLDDNLIANGKLVIRAHGVVKPWVEIPLQFLMNPHLFVALATYAYETARDAYRAERQRLRD